MQQKFLYLLSVVVLVAVALLFANFLVTSRMPSLTSQQEFCTGPLKQCVDKKVKYAGTVSNLMQQHLISPRGGYTNEAYLDNPKSPQIVIYTKQPLGVSAGKKIEVTGKVIAVGTEGGAGQKLEEPYTEYQILVDSWREVL